MVAFDHLQSGLGRKDHFLERSLSWAGRRVGKDSFKLVSAVARKLRSKGAETHLQLESDSIFAFPLGDNYWSKAVFLRHDYEPEIGNFLIAVRDVDYTFIDCGANFGFWSVMASSKAYGNKQVLAIELDPDNFTVLARNAALNGNRFAVLNRAVFSASGNTMQVFGGNHFAYTIAPDAHKVGQQRTVQIETIALDDAILAVSPPLKKMCIIKLDVEGAEIEAVRGAQKMLKQGALVVFEDEKNDVEAGLSGKLMDEFGLAIYAIGEKDAPTLMHAISDVRERKHTGSTNFVAIAKTSPWRNILGDASRYTMKVN